MEYKIIKQRSRLKKNIELSAQLIKQFNLSPLCADYLIAKGFNDIDSAERFLYPSETHLNNPFSLPDMKKAVERIEEAVEKKQKVVIFGDYDCDGVCASVILYKALKAKGAMVSVFLPDRFADGYGMSLESVQKLCEDGCNLIITVDNGITAEKEIALASSYGVDVILTDHHEPPETIPDAYALIDAKLSQSAYPFDELCGASVALKLAQAFGIEQRSLLEELTVFAAVATIADLVPLINENRTIASLGLKYIQKRLNPGLDELICLCEIKDLNNISASDISFKVAPRINACGRLENAYSVFELFTETSKDKLKALANLLNDNNEKRKQIEEKMILLADNYLHENNLLEKENVLFIPIENAHEGVVGIAAGKIVERYNRPAIVGSVLDGKITASARSIPGFNIYEALCAGNELYLKFGGHSQAAGFTIEENNFERLSELVHEKAEQMSIKRMLVPHLYYDVEAVPSYLSLTAVRQLDSFAPYGIKNPRPVFELEGADIRGVTFLGQDRQHVRMNVVKGSSNLSAIAFGAGSEFSKYDFSQQAFDVLFTPSVNSFRGNESVQLEIRGLLPHIKCPNAYYESLYDHFCINLGSDVDYVPKDEQLSKESVEALLDSDVRRIFIVYGKDMLLRILRYCDSFAKQTVISYGKAGNYSPGKVNVLVNPCTANIDSLYEKRAQVLVMDKPCFCGYESRLYSSHEQTVFNLSGRYLPSVLMDREYIAFIYKKLPMLENTENDLERFIDFLNVESPLPVNYFLLRICLDILSELCIIDYEMVSGKLYIKFEKITGIKDIYSSTVIQKLIRAYS